MCKVLKSEPFDKIKHPIPLGLGVVGTEQHQAGRFISLTSNPLRKSLKAFFGKILEGGHLCIGGWSEWSCSFGVVCI